MLVAHVEHLGRDEALHQPEHVRVGPALDLTEQAPVVRAGKSSRSTLDSPSGREPLREIEAPAANDVAIDIKAHPLRIRDALRIAICIHPLFDGLGVH